MYLLSSVLISETQQDGKYYMHSLRTIFGQSEIQNMVIFLKVICFYLIELEMLREFIQTHQAHWSL